MRHPFEQRRLGEILLDSAGLAQAQLEHALGAQDGARLGECLLAQGMISESQLAQALAVQFHLRYVDLDDFTVPAACFELISATTAYQFNFAPYALVDGRLQLVIADPFDVARRERLERISGVKIEFLLSTAGAINAALQRSKGRSEVLRGLSEDFRALVITQDAQGQDRVLETDEADDESAPVIKLVNSILSAAMQKRASDIHIEIFEKGISVKYRIDGVLYAATEVLDKRHHAPLISRLKVMADMDIAEKRVPQDGRFRLQIGDRAIDCRVSILPSSFGEDVVIRLLDKSSLGAGLSHMTLEHLGIDAQTQRRFRKSIREPYGMVLITGPTGSGKTTTLYAALSELNANEEKIITIEDPVEYQLDGIIQIPVNEKKNLTFARGLRSILRHDPDRIMVGEIRDEETAKIAVQSALTGHLVFSTVHANTVFDVIWRFANMGIELHNFISALNCIMAQRLVRRICERCKQPWQADEAELEASGLVPADYQDTVWYHGAGCTHCSGTGYRGRIAITEFLELTPQLRDMISTRQLSAQIQAAAIAEGFISLRQSALAKALAGDTSLHEINRVTFVE